MDHCEKYADWIADAAAGGLTPGRATQLFGHTEECDACREAYRRAHELAACVDRGVESLVAGEASPYFASRLRARIAEERAPARFARLGWKPITVGLLVAAFAGAAVLSRMSHRQNPEPVAVGLEANLESNSATNELKAGRGSPNLGPRDAIQTRPISHQRHAARNIGSPRQPEVLVPPGQLDAILQFARAARSGQIDGKQLLAAQQETEKPLEMTPIEIAPLSPLQPEVASNTPDDGRK